MNTGVKIGAFAAALAVTFGAAYGVGSGVGPLGTEPAASHQEGGHGGDDGDGGGHGAQPPGGLQVADRGYALDLATRTVPAGAETELRFRVLDEDGEPLTAYRKEHEKELHLIIVSRDLETFRHLHPTRAADGTWRTDVELPRAGDYRVFTDFTPAAEGADALTLGADLAASGSYDPAEAPTGDARTSEVGDGYTVTLDGTLRPGRPGDLTLKVAKDGKPVTDLQPYLGAYGHLVALRAGDLAYLHVHPSGEPGDGRTAAGPEVTFAATAPSAGTYRLFLDFRHDGEVRTADFTLTAEGTPPPAEQPDHGDTDGEGDTEGGHGH